MLGALPKRLPLHCREVELPRQLLVRAITEGLFDELAGQAALAAGKALGFDLCGAVRRNGDFYGFQVAPPATCTVSLMEPSASDCSTTAWPFFLASILVFSTAYI